MVWPSPEPGVGDSHLQQPIGPEAVAAAAAGPTVSRLLSVSVRVGSVDIEETSLAEVEEEVEGWCWWCCWGLLLTAAPVL